MKQAILVLVAFTLLFSCSKYEDGPSVSLKSKTKRITGEWEVISVADTSLSDFKLRLSIEEDGDASFTPIINIGFMTIDQISIGAQWEWTYKKEGIQIIVDMDAVSELLSVAGDFNVNTSALLKEKFEFDILRLTNDELWIRDESDSVWKLEKRE